MIIYLNNIGSGTVEASIPTVTSNWLYNNNSTVLSHDYTITSNGNAAITQYGLVFDTTADPIIATGTIIEYGTDNFVGNARLFSAVTSASLSASTTYYARFFATNSEGTGYSSINEIFITDADSNVYSSVLIGTQRWLGFNWAEEPDSDPFRFVDNSNTNTANYGLLYPYASIAGVLPTGWHIPTQAEFKTLITAVGGTATGDVATATTSHGVDPEGLMNVGTDYWRYDYGELGTDVYKFHGRGAGRYTTAYSGFQTGLYMWTSTVIHSSKYLCELSGISPTQMYLTNGNSYVNTNYYSVRLIQDTAVVPTIERYTAGDDFYNDSQTQCIYKINITDVGTDGLCSVGICLDTHTSPTTEYEFDASVSSPGVITLTFSDTSYIPVLVANTTYYIRPYARNTIGVVYGAERIALCLEGSKSIPEYKTLYATEQIGTQLWTKFNISANKDKNGDSVTAYYPNNDSNNEGLYGLLYDWASANLLAPTGWHLPSLSELQTLSTYLGGDSMSGAKLKESGTTYWTTPNTGAVNSARFYGRGAGVYGGLFNSYVAIWGSGGTSGRRNSLSLSYNSTSSAIISSEGDINGNTVRLIKD